MSDEGDDKKQAPEPPPAKPVREDDAESARLCNAWVESGLTKNKSIQFLLQTLIDSGCSPPDKFIRCMNCKQPQAGGFGVVLEQSIVLNDANTATSDRKTTTSDAAAASALNSKEQCQRTAKEIQDQFRRANAGSSQLKLLPDIFVCQQYMEDEHMVHKTVHHELIHAIDLCRIREMDPLRNCIHLACTELRAENLSGECSLWRELPRITHFAGHGQECVRRRTILSVRANPNCAQRAEEYVTAALPRCFQDYYPYDRHPNQR
jgi:Peptidase M76 family